MAKNKKKREKLWTKDGLYRLDDNFGCHCCYWYYDSETGPQCHAPGKRMNGGYCEQFMHKDADSPREADAADMYEKYMSDWN